MNLDKYTGSWTEKQARHLLKRTTFGPSELAVSEAIDLGLERSVNKLLEDNDLFKINREDSDMNLRGPLKYTPDGPYANLGKGIIQHNDPAAKRGFPWASEERISAIPDDPNLTKAQKDDLNRANRTFRRKSLRSWIFIQMEKADFNIRMKLALFWHNHFVSIDTKEYPDFFYFTLLMDNALGNFKSLTEKVTLDFSMMHYLDNNGNNKDAPNENYARELLELFTLGKGDSVGNGDYTNYTEEDISEIAKALTGWKFFVGDSQPSFRNHLHDLSDKKLSHRFNNAIIKENGENEYIDVIDIIFKQESCANFLAKNLYQWFVKPQISDEIEKNIIKPLGNIIRNSNYEVIPALKVLLSSKHFYETSACMIKSPIDFIFSLLKPLSVKIPEANESDLETLLTQYQYASFLHSMCTDLEQQILNHPEVAGWKAYYQSPNYDESWINSHLLPLRVSYAKGFVTGEKIFVHGRGEKLEPANVLKAFENIDDIENPISLIKGLSMRLFNYDLSDTKIEQLKNILIPGLPNRVWTTEYEKYLKNPNDETIKSGVERRLRNLVSTMVQMPEFQVM